MSELQPRGHKVEQASVQLLKFGFRKSCFNQKSAYVCLGGFVVILPPLQHQMATELPDCWIDSHVEELLARLSEDLLLRIALPNQF